MDAPRGPSHDALCVQAEVEKGQRQTGNQGYDPHEETSVHGELDDGPVDFKLLGIAWCLVG
jgi:hypothetical protein